MRKPFVLWVVAFFGLLGSSDLRAGYVQVPADFKPFTETLTLDEPARIQLTDALVDWARTKASGSTPLNEPEWKMVSRSMALAKALQSTHRGFLVADFQFSGKGTPTKPERLLEDKPASDLLFKALQSTALKTSTKKDEQRLYGYLMELIANLNPANEDAIVDFSLFQKEKEVNNWSLLLPEQAGNIPAQTVGATAVPGVVPKTWSGPQLRSIKGLLVMQTAGGIWVGKTSNLIGTVGSTNPDQGVTATFDRISMESSASLQNPYSRQNPNNNGSNNNPNQESSGVGSFGKEMRITLDEALRLVNSRHLGLKGAPSINLGFEDKYTPKDGGSIGAACGLLILSIVENYDIDPAFAITGDLNADGRIKAVGGIDAKIEGAYAGSAKAVVIPSENKEDLEEMLIMGQNRLIGDIQIFSAATIQEAQDLVRTDKPDNIKKAMALFDQLQRSGNFNAQKINEVIQLAPNHLSAQMFAEQYNGTAPRALSLKSSINRIVDAAGPFVAILMADKNRSVTLDRSERFTIPELPQSVFDVSRNELDKISKKIDPKTQNFYWSVTQLLDVWQEFQINQTKTSSATTRRKFIEARTSFHERLSELQMDETTIKALLR
jgi:hypothetical protein